MHHTALRHQLCTEASKEGSRRQLAPGRHTARASIPRPRAPPRRHAHIYILLPGVGEYTAEGRRNARRGSPAA
jgi:hypothetical protein